jgi:NADPH-dependent curcumin reductase CurA
MYVGALGMPGMTAYSSLYEIGKPKKGETIFISAASGAVGQIVGQLAKREGLFVVGSAGSDDKVKYLVDTLHFDAAFNYKKEKPLEALSKYCPKGIDIYFENVGGETLDAVLLVANRLCRIIACGMISQYNTADAYGVKNLINIVAKSITMTGFIVSDFWAKYDKEFYENMEKFIHDGQIVYQEDITKGLEHGAAAFIGMLKGQNFGKAMIQIK